MDKLSKANEIEKLKLVLMKKIKSENDDRYKDLSSDEVMKIVIESSNKGKYVLWVLREYLKDNIQRFEDMNRCKQALTLFKNNLSKFSEQEKQLNKMSFQELETLVEPYQDVLTQNAIKRMSKEKIWSEIEVVYEGPEGRIYIPKTKEASVFLGQGTKWCTAATDVENMFEYYNKQGPLYVFVTNKKDEKGREKKYQLHFESEQFMNSEDSEICIGDLDGHSNLLLSKFIQNLSVSKKIELFLSNDLFFNNFDVKEEFGDFYFDLYLKRSFMEDGLGGIEEHIRTEDDVLNLLEICNDKTFLRHNFYFNEINDSIKTEQVCKLFCKQNLLNLHYVPDKILTKAFLLDVFENCDDSSINSCSEENILKFITDDDVANVFIRKFPEYLKFVPNKFKNNDFYKIAVSKSPYALKNVPENMRTREICEIAVKQSKSVMDLIPTKYFDKKLFDIAFDSNENKITFISENISPYIPKELKDAEMCLKMAKEGRYGLCRIPDEMLNQKLCDIAVKNDINSFKIVPEKYKTYKMCEFVVDKDGKYLNYVPERMVTYDLCKSAIRNTDSFVYIPNEFKTFELLKIGIESEPNFINIILDDFNVFKKTTSHFGGKQQEDDSETIYYARGVNSKNNPASKNAISFSKKEIIDLIKIALKKNPCVLRGVTKKIIESSGKSENMYELELFLLEYLANEADVLQIENFTNFTNIAFENHHIFYIFESEQEEKNVEQLFIKIVEKYGCFIKFIQSEERKKMMNKYPGIVSKIIKNAPVSLKYIQTSFISKDDFKNAIEQNGMCFGYSPNLSEKDYYELLKIAIRQNPRALKFHHDHRKENSAEYVKIALDTLIEKENSNEKSHLDYLNKHYSDLSINRLPVKNYYISLLVDDFCKKMNSENNENNSISFS